MGLTGSYESPRIAQAEVRKKCANSILVRVRFGPTLTRVYRRSAACSDNFRASPRPLLVERLGQNLPVGELDGKAEQQAFGRGASIACRSARSVTPGAGGTYLSSKVETGEKNEL